METHFRHCMASSFDGNPGLCSSDPCKKKKISRVVIAVVASVVAFVVVLAALIVLWVLKRRKQQDNDKDILNWETRLRMAVEAAQGDIRSTVDPRLKGDFNINSVWKAVEIAMACVSQTSSRRPTMNHVMMELNECLATETARRKENANEFETGDYVEMMTVNLHNDLSPQARYKDDVYGRIWWPLNLNKSRQLNTSVTIDANGSNIYVPAPIAMQTAATPKKDSQPLNYFFNTSVSSTQYYIYMHFAEVEELQANQFREFNISLNGQHWFDGNPGLCSSNTCKKKKNSRVVIAVVASVIAFVVILAALIGLRVLKRRKQQDNDKDILNWETRLRMAVEAAQGLEYLHHGCKPPIIHRDVKSTNILLNDKFQAKLADFGLSRTFSVEGDTHVSTVVAGTPGYLDPEYYMSNRLTEKSDVYSFGVVLLELITGKPIILKSLDNSNSHIIQWVSFNLAKGDIRNTVDPRMKGEFNINSVWKAVETAMACVCQTSSRRPTMNNVVLELNECLATETARRKENANEFETGDSVEMMTVNPHNDVSPLAR
ncbi:hypothetical protein EZV62_003672 [Acer yangbiense]|uniref:Protein kinase domain-containing protein n=1 Tax=Acer yangbiense TaxID=1000413 RepID=A0A5C7IHD8_9ROSI|nr:hypothetical protein EZV62_003672 [Acer yangbiense]